MFRHKRRSTNIVFVIFRLLLSMMMFTVLLAGVYTAYKHFSGLDPLKVDPVGIFSRFLANLSSIKVTPKFSIESKPNQSPKETAKPSTSKSRFIFEFALVADSHSDNNALRKALIQAKDKNSVFVIGMGDYTEVGTLKELQDAKKEFDNAGLRYFLLVGDHDLWDSRNRSLPPNSNFREIFGPSYQSFTYDKYLFLLLYNSDNYLGISQDQLEWLTAALERAKEDELKGIFVFAHEPLYHPSSEHVMGWVEKGLKTQARNLIMQLQDAGVKKVFAGDIHFFSEYSEPVTNLQMVTVGAVTSERNPQTPRLAIVSVFEDGSSAVEDVEIK